jgi:hypothetical protein
VLYIETNLLELWAGTTKRRSDRQNAWRCLDVRQPMWQAAALSLSWPAKQLFSRLVSVPRPWPPDSSSSCRLRSLYTLFHSSRSSDIQARGQEIDVTDGQKSFCKDIRRKRQHLFFLLLPLGLLLWIFGSFSGHGLPVSRVSRQSSFYEFRMSAPRLTPSTGSGCLSFTSLKTCAHWVALPAARQPLAQLLIVIQGGSNMTGTNCDLFTHNQSRSYLNHLVYKKFVLHLVIVTLPIIALRTCVREVPIFNLLETDGCYSGFPEYVRESVGIIDSAKLSSCLVMLQRVTLTVTNP